jgi:hydrogenase assembly chaperone HypC/HupF
VCLGFPGRVSAIDAGGATIDTEGRRRRASTLLMPELAVGDWVFVAAGTVIRRLEPNEAAKVRSTLLAAIAVDAVDRTATPTNREGRAI